MLIFSIDLRQFCYFRYALLLNVRGIFFVHKYLVCLFVVFLDTTFSLQTNQSITLAFYHHQKVQKPSSCYQTKQPVKDISISGVNLLRWGRSWLILEFPGFSQSLALHYRTKSVWTIVLELYVASYVFQSLISFL